MTGPLPPFTTNTSPCRPSAARGWRISPGCAGCARGMAVCDSRLPPVVTIAGAGPCSCTSSAGATLSVTRMSPTRRPAVRQRGLAMQRGVQPKPRPHGRCRRCGCAGRVVHAHEHRGDAVALQAQRVINRIARCGSARRADPSGRPAAARACGSRNSADLCRSAPCGALARACISPHPPRSRRGCGRARCRPHAPRCVPPRPRGHAGRRTRLARSAPPQAHFEVAPHQVRELRSNSEATASTRRPRCSPARTVTVVLASGPAASPMMLLNHLAPMAATVMLLERGDSLHQQPWPGRAKARAVGDDEFTFDHGGGPVRRRRR